MNNTLNIRFAKETDMEQIIQLCALHAAYEQADYNTKDKAQNLSRYLFAPTPALYCLVVELDGKIIAYATYMKQFSTWDAGFYIYMDCLFLTESNRGLGIGQKLVERIQEEAKTLACDFIQWQTPDFNVRAQKFYHRIGAKSKEKVRFFLRT